ncbi:hypothetical protein V6N13_148162 [Hibiscus sabdariffa]
MLVKKAEELCIGGLKGDKDMLYEFDTEGFPLLKYLTLRKSSEIKWIINSMAMRLALRKAFPVIETMHFNFLTSLEKICHGELKTGSFSQLTTIIREGNDENDMLLMLLDTGICQSTKAFVCRR